MKLRIQSNSIRMRLKQGEIAQFREHGRVAGKLELGPQTNGGDCQPALVYAVEAADVEAVAVRFNGGEICVLIPRSEARQWTESEQVGIETQIGTPGAELSVLVEKDFKCLHREPSAEDQDSFPHPRA